MAEDAPTAVERIAEAFNRYFANSDIPVEPGPDDDINANLRTGADRTHGGIGSADAPEGGP